MIRRARRHNAATLLVHGTRYESTQTICGRAWGSLDHRTESFAFIRGPKQHGRGSVNCPDCLRRLDQALDAIASTVHAEALRAERPSGES